MLEQVYQAYIWCTAFVAVLALAGSFDFRRVVIGDFELLKALGAVMGHFFFLQFWYAFIRPDDAIGQPWLLMFITLPIVAWVVTVRPASKLSAAICGFCMIGILANAVCGASRMLVGFSAETDFLNWYANHAMGWAILLTIAGWSCDNIGRHLGLWGHSRSDVAHVPVSAGGKK